MAHGNVLTTPRVASKQDKQGFDRNVELCSKLVREQVTKGIVQRYYPSNRMPIGDVAWDCFTHLFMRKFFDRYDYNISGKYYYLRRGIRNYLIDKERVDGKKVKCVSGDMTIAEDTELFDILDVSIQDTVKNEILYMDMLNTLRDTEFSKAIKYRSKKIRVAETMELGTVTLSYYSVLYLYLSGHSFSEISILFGVSSTYISGVFNAAIDNLKIVYTDEMMDRAAGSEELNDRISKYRGFEYVPECPKCGATDKRVKFKEYDMEFGKPIHVCKDCNNQFTPLSDTPVNGVKNKLLYLDFCKMSLEKATKADVLTTLEISSDLFNRWDERTGTVFMDWGAEYSIAFINYVRIFFKKHKELGKYSNREE